MAKKTKTQEMKTPIKYSKRVCTALSLNILCYTQRHRPLKKIFSRPSCRGTDTIDWDYKNNGTLLLSSSKQLSTKVRTPLGSLQTKVKVSKTRNIPQITMWQLPLIETLL